MPQYPGGSRALRRFIDENLKYPAAALENNIEGVVYLSYTVADDGQVEDIKVMKGPGYGCEEEAVRVVSLLRYEPAHNRGLRVRTTLRTRIHFRIPAAPAPVVKYEYSKGTDPGTKKPAEKPAVNLGYGYTITYSRPDNS